MADVRQDVKNAILITGGTDGLGRATAVLLAEHGYRVFAGGRHPGKLAELGQLAHERELPLKPIELDVCSDASIDRAFLEIARSGSLIDVLVNNAGICIVAVMEEISIEDLRKQFETNFFGAVRMVQRVLPEMRRRGRGRIINMSSLSGKVVQPLWGPYASTKYALEAISDAMRLELYPFNIQVVLVEPGYIATNIKNIAEELSGAYAAGAEQSPYAGIYRPILKWLRSANHSRSTPEDCAHVILRAVEDTPPRTRYPVTRGAKAWLLARRLLSDRALDHQYRKMFGLNELRAAIQKGAQG
ncbi:MAG TPA: SDR family oxidoreductase [Candidatus Acidoferrum sp.]|nr:SDR family oxidoreductase [Candidatus Acidoferrum sp.]